MKSSGEDVAVPGAPSTVGAVTATAFYIFDNDCNIMGEYSPSCSMPWTIEENFLIDALSVTTVSMSFADSPFQFSRKMHLTMPSKMTRMPFSTSRRRSNMMKKISRQRM
jgi:hypothetical protein